MSKSLTPTLTLTSSTASTDPVSISLTDTLTITDPIETGKVNITTGAGTVGRNTLIPSSDSNTYYVFLQNTDSTNFVLVRRDNGSNMMKLHAGEFAYFTLADGIGLEMQADTDTVKVQYGFWKKG
tara:strand:+ start:1249 stop:1623 length:375 start_codon:yes stop_codon:yes gene_type:complete